MINLSIDAQAVHNAFNNASICAEVKLAASLRAAARRLTPYTVSEMDGAAMAYNKLIDIAAELESQYTSEINSES